MAEVFLPYMELFRRPVTPTLEEVKEAGFDGVECHLIGSLRSIHRADALREKATHLGLKVRFHQGWSWQTGQRNLFNHLLRPLGALVPVGMPLAEQVLAARTDPVVVYGNLVGAQRQPNYLYQTASEHIDGRAYALPFGAYEERVVRSRLPGRLRHATCARVVAGCAQCLRTIAVFTRLLGYGLRFVAEISSIREGNTSLRL